MGVAKVKPVKRGKPVRTQTPNINSESRIQTC